MAYGDQDRSNLLLGRYQINQTVVTREAEAADWRLALVHHPWDYLAEFDAYEARQTIHLHRDLLLRGHLHEGEAAYVRPADPERACLELAAGCLYESSRYPNAFQWIELYAAPRRVRVLFQLWNKGAWQADRNQPGADSDGALVFPLEGPPPDRSRATVAKAQAIPAEYLAWLRHRYGGVDLLGQDAQQGQAITLSQVYVPALTVPAPSERSEAPAPEQEAQKPTLLLQRLDETSLYCPAPPGAGKSTFCRWAVLQAIPGSTATHPVAAPDDFAEPVPADLRRRLPLLVPLREFWRAMDCGHGRRDWRRAELEQALGTWVDQAPPEGLHGALLEAHLAQGSAFLLLDGLDEVPVSQLRDGETLYPRALLLSGLADALPHWRQTGNRVLLTSRPYGLDASGLARLGLPDAPLEPLPWPLQELFVARWFHTLDKSDLAGGLTASIGERDDLNPLAENPMLLTALCVIYGNGRRLPEDRYHLYQRIVDNVLYNRYPGDARSREPVKARLEAIAHGMHTGEGLDEERRTPVAEASDAELERLLRTFARLNPAYEQGRVEPAVQREELLARSGLLLPRPNGRAAFYHLSFQEHLAAGIFQYRNAQWGLDLLTRLAGGLDRSEVQANPAQAVLVAEALELCLAKGYAIPDGLTERFRQNCLDAIEDEIAIPARHTLGLLLGRLGDPRILSLRDPAAYVEVPAGDYVYGEENEKIHLDAPFLLGRYPVTNGQYRAFMDDNGYVNRHWWSDEGWAWLQQEGVTEPAAWQERRWNGPNQPVVGLSFWEAEACCRWAGGRLPTEHEWEAAARGPDGCEYPWCGDWEDGICNSSAAGLGVTSAVGLFPRSRQKVFEIEDLAVNVWEWCDSFYGREVYGASRVLRGGSFWVGSGVLRSSGRYGNVPVFRGWDVGFRCVLAPPRQL